MSAALPAAVAAGAAAIAALETAAELLPPVRARLPGLVKLAGAFRRMEREGRDPGAAERRRLLAAGAAAAGGAGLLLAGPLAGVALACAAPYAMDRALRARHARYRRAVEEGAPQLALALADALTGGHSLRGAITEGAPGVPGPAGVELRRVAAELRLGAPTDATLEAMAARVGGHSIDTIVSAALVQRAAGGDLAALLRGAARGFEAEARLAGEVRAATAQARFTGLVVVLLPVGGALLGSLADPGFVPRILSSFLTAWLVGVAAALQVTAAVAIRRLGRVKA